MTTADFDNRSDVLFTVLCFLVLAIVILKSHQQIFINKINFELTPKTLLFSLLLSYNWLIAQLSVLDLHDY